MLDAAEAATRFMAGRDRDDLDGDLELLMAVSHCLQIIGEAAGRLSDNAKAMMPEIPWRAVRGMRNQIVHVYFDVDTDVVWDTVTGDLPPLIASLRGFIEDTSEK